MRIRFATRNDDGETPAEQDLRDRIDVFWRAAQRALASAPAGPSPGEIARRLEPPLVAALESVAPGLDAEVDALPDGGLRVVVAPRSEGALEPLVGALLARAPVLRGATLVRHRPELPVGAAVADVEARTGVDLSGARARLGFGRGHLLEVVVYSPGFTSAKDDRALDAANLLLPRLVGDELFDDWVGSIDVAPLARGGSLRVMSDGATTASDTLDLAEVLPAFEAAVRGVYAALPEAPYHVFCERGEWVMMELEPEPADDYAALDDLALVSTMLPEATKCFLEGARFSSRRFSRHGERIAYVKVDAGPMTPMQRYEHRSAIEEALNIALVPGRIGCVVGAGVGLRYVSLVLALENVDHGVRVACDKLRKLGVSRRSWVLFCDSAWANEWVGVWPETPEPPA